jgi:hypothetical protein
MRNTILFAALIAMFLSSCKRVEDSSKPRKTTVRILSNNGLQLFKAESDGPFLIGIEGADVSIQLLKQEPKIEEEAEKSAKK